jgi:hypothetical protein
LNGIQISDPLLLGIHFFLAIRYGKELAVQISLKSKVPSFSSEFSSISTHRNFLEFSFKFQFESGQVFIRNVVPYLKLFPSILYLQFFEPGRSTFWVKTNQTHLKSI